MPRDRVGVRSQRGCVGAGEGDILEDRMRAGFNSFVFTFRYWRTIAGSAD
jgi:hypothetical protein